MGKKKTNNHGDGKPESSDMRNDRKGKQREPGLQENAEWHRSLFTNNHTVMLVIDPRDGSIIDANPAAVRFYGWLQDELKRKKITEINVASPEQIQHEMKKALTGTDGHFIFQHRLADGTVRDVEVFSGPVTLQGQPRLYSIIYDITERKKMEARVIAEKQWSETLINAVPNIIVGLGERSRILLFNKFAEKLTGYTAEEVIGREWVDIFIPTEKRAELYGVFEEISANGLVEHQHENEIITKTGERRVISWHNTAISENGNFRILLSIGEDITARKKLERELLQEKEYFRLTFEASPDAININRLEDGLYVEINKGFTAITGFTREEIIGKTAAEIGIWADPADRERLMAELRETGEVNNMECLFRMKGGGLVTGLMSVRMIDLNGVRHTLFITRDIETIKEAQRKLSESEAKYRTILEDMQESYYEVDLAGDLTFFNDSLCRLLGYPREELMNMNNRSYMDGENAKKLYQAFNQVYRTGEPTTGFDWEIIRKDGARRTIEASVSLRKDTSGVSIGFQGLIRDITEEKLAEHMVRESEERFRGIYENVSIGLYRTTPNGRILMANPAMVRMLGYASFEELAERNLETDPIHDEKLSREKFKELLEKNGSVTGLESILKRKDGTTLWVRESARAVLDETGKILNFEGTIEDVTERKRAEKELIKNERFLDSVLESIQDGVSVLNTNLLIRHVNKTMKEWYKENLPLEGKKCYEAYHNSTTPCNSCPTLRCFESGKTETDIVPGLPGSPVEWIELFSYPIKDPDSDEVTGVVEFVRDITERKQAESERESLQEQLLQSQKIESVGRLAGGVAHDFNNMLGVILGRAEMMLAKMAPDDPNRAGMEAIMRAGTRSAALTRQLLAFARKQTIQPRVMNLNDEIEGTLKMLRRLIGENIDLAWQPATGLWTVEMDPVQVDQILANLCVNAKDAIPEAGEITIETENRPMDETYCAMHPEAIPGTYVMLAVSDDGSGMDEETRSHIFDPFFTTKEVGKGTGLGLSTVYGIVKQNKGFINVYSEPGKGTTFRIYIPRHGGELSEEMETVVQDIPCGEGQKILLVEDEAVLLEMAKTMLEELGYEVYAESRPVDALSYLRENGCHMDLLMTDVVMPGMSGKELADEVNRMCEGVKVLYMSGYTANAIAHHGVLDKGVAFIQKPFPLNELAQKVKNVLD
ncbi:MAG: PAS domain S-box protein [Acidobacteria bacterium]|nr:PAS domain S-box protein [Acidobacteriota bacterium]